MLMGSSTPQNKGVSPISGVGAPVRPLGDPSKVQQLQQEAIGDTIEDSDRLMRRENSALMNTDVLGENIPANELTQLRLQQQNLIMAREQASPDSVMTPLI